MATLDGRSERRHLELGGEPGGNGGGEVRVDGLDGGERRSPSMRKSFKLMLLVRHQVVANPDGRNRELLAERVPDLAKKLQRGARTTTGRR